MAEDFISGRFTARIDLADFMLKQLTTDTYLHKAVAVVTFSGQPTLLQFLAREVFQRQPRSDQAPL